MNLTLSILSILSILSGSLMATAPRLALASLVAVSQGDAWNEATRQLLEKAARDAKALEQGQRRNVLRLSLKPEQSSTILSGYRFGT